MKYLNIASTVVFELRNKVVDKLANDLLNMEKNKGGRFQPLETVDNVTRSTKYVNYQMKRLVRYAKEGKFKHFDYLSKVLLRNSKTYLIYSLNHVYPNWCSLKMTHVMKTLKKVIMFAKTDRNVLEYKRVWIDKKLDDYGRPLGVPYSADRIYGHMMTRIMECYLHGTNQIPSNQHGGISRRGTLTFLRELVKKFNLSERIFEFDIKGYFDHISHESLLNLVKESKVLTHYLQGALKSQPIEFDMPPIDKDITSRPESLEDDEAFWDAFYSKYKPEIELKKPISEFSLETLQVFDFAFGPSWRQGLPDLDEFFDSGAMDYVPGGKYTFQEWEAKLQEFLTGVYKEETMAGIYSDIMKGTRKTLDVHYVEAKFTESERIKGREKWKDLDLRSQGVPQGSSFGPLLASVVLGQVLPASSLLYMDDGIIFLGKTKVTTEGMINRVNNYLAPIMCELNTDKSGILSTTKLWSTGLKIIGMRLKRDIQIRNIFTGITITSETRAGIKKAFLNYNKENVEHILREMYDRKLITVSKYRVLKWYVQSGRLEIMSRSPIIELMDQLGLLGAVVSRAFSPTVDLEEMKRQIEYGIYQAELRMRRAEGSIGERLLATGQLILLECSEKRVFVRPTLFNVRAIANDVLLRYFKGELPSRGLRVQGLRKAFNRTTVKGHDNTENRK